jgi:hypothetical protein
MADAAMEALNVLYLAGYDKEVTLIREFITAQGEAFQKTIKLQREIVNDFAKQSGKT